MKLRRAFSVIEILVATTLFLLMLGGLYAIYALGLRYLRMAETQSRLQQQASIAIQKIQRDLSLSLDVPGAIVGGSGAAIFLSSADPLPGTVEFNYNSDGRLEWRKWLCYHCETGTSRLLVSEIALTGGPSIFPIPSLSAPPLSQFKAVTGPGQRLVAENVESMVVVREGAGVYGIGVVTALPGMNGALSKVHLSTKVFILNCF